MVAMQTNDKPIANPVVVLREEFDDWAVLFNPDTARAVGLNPIGVELWKHLDGKHSAQDLLALVQQNYSGVPANALEDIQQFTQALAQGGFVGYEVILEG
jgi:SynChlorMet cassette protein ScmD